MFSAENTNNCSKSGRRSSGWLFCRLCKQSAPALGLEGLRDLAGKLQSFEGHHILAAQEIHRRARNLDVNVGPAAICRGEGHADTTFTTFTTPMKLPEKGKGSGFLAEEARHHLWGAGRGCWLHRKRLFNLKARLCSSLQPHGELISTCAIDRKRETRREWRGGSDCAGCWKAFVSWTNTSAVLLRGFAGVSTDQFLLQFRSFTNYSDRLSGGFSFSSWWPHSADLRVSAAFLPVSDSRLMLSAPVFHWFNLLLFPGT